MPNAKAWTSLRTAKPLTRLEALHGRRSRRPCIGFHATKAILPVSVAVIFACRKTRQESPVQKWIAIALWMCSAAAWAGNPFVGSWKFDPARSRLVAETVHYADLGGGRMHYSNGATLQYDFA